MRRFGLMVASSVLAMLASLNLAAVASAADSCMHDFGSHQRIADAGGMQELSVTDLRPSDDMPPGYLLSGRPWEANVSITATTGAVTPLIPNFSAHTSDGVSYPVLWQLASPQGISGATLAQGQTAAGKIYFDATASDPESVTYTSGDARPLMWCCSQAMMTRPMADCTCCSDMGSCTCCAGPM